MSGPACHFDVFDVCDSTATVRVGSRCTACGATENCDYCDDHYRWWLALNVGAIPGDCPACLACKATGVGLFALSEPIALRVAVAS